MVPLCKISQRLVADNALAHGANMLTPVDNRRKVRFEPRVDRNKRRGKH
jgi:hypothetical protein